MVKFSIFVFEFGEIFSSDRLEFCAALSQRCSPCTAGRTTPLWGGMIFFYDDQAVLTESVLYQGSSLFSVSYHGQVICHTMLSF